MRKKDLELLLALEGSGVAVPTEYFTIFYSGFSAFFEAYPEMGFPLTSLCFQSPIFPFILLEICKS
jgi:hypothetical protein